MTVSTLMSADELLRLPEDGSRYELVRGELRKMSPAGEEHGFVGLRIAISLGQFVYKRHLGRVYNADTGFRITRNPDTVLAPDVAFVRSDRVAPTPKYFEGAPDLAIEVVSPSDTYDGVEEKAATWLRAGCRAVVVVTPKTKTARVHCATGVVNLTDAIEIDDVLPGWKLALAEIFG